ncbi:porin family protein [Methylophilus aquaticus]|uniref:Porin family protein n=1 Tax=Methylophilus aquaticus TaxID=1971610 RepID=A0ABT9JQF2_9PROT|nr:porin family protein [Methylophilus aquaticus]MDP8566791.1 porin family protein [Methylophilus aquaticus]
MKAISSLIITGALLASTSFPASAEGFYGGLNLGLGMPDLRTPSGVDKDKQAVVGALAGYKFNDYFGIEGQYTGIGKVTDNVSGSVKADALSLTAVGFVPLNDGFNLYGKLGVASTKSKVSGDLPVYSDATHTGATYGLGAEYHFDKNIAMRVGWDRYKAAVDVTGGGSKTFDSNVTSVGFTYSF